MVLGVKVAIPKSAAASLEALANFALDGCEEPFGATGDAYDTASTAVRNPFGGSDVTVRNPPRIPSTASVFIILKKLIIPQSAGRELTPRPPRCS